MSSVLPKPSRIRTCTIHKSVTRCKEEKNLLVKEAHHSIKKTPPLHTNVHHLHKTDPNISYFIIVYLMESFSLTHTLSLYFSCPSHFHLKEPLTNEGLWPGLFTFLLLHLMLVTGCSPWVWYLVHTHTTSTPIMAKRTSVCYWKYQSSTGTLVNAHQQRISISFHLWCAQGSRWWLVKVLLYIHRHCRFIRDRSPGCPPRLSHTPELRWPGLIHYLSRVILSYTFMTRRAKILKLLHTFATIFHFGQSPTTSSTVLSACSADEATAEMNTASVRCRCSYTLSHACWLLAY